MEPSIVRLRELPEGDLAPLLAASESEGFRFVRRVLDEWRSGINRFANPGEALFGAFCDGTLAGVCGLMRDPYADQDGVGRLRNLYVLPRFRGRGLGALLTRAVIAQAAKGFAVLRLRAGTEGAARLYERLGFEPTSGVPDCTHRHTG